MIRIEYCDAFFRLVLSGIVDVKEVNNILEELEPLEKEGKLKHFDRIADLRLVKNFDLNFSDVYAFSQRRKKIVFPVPFKSAIVVNSNLTMGFARMFQTLNDHPDIDMQIFKTMEDAEGFIRGCG